MVGPDDAAQSRGGIVTEEHSQGAVGRAVNGDRKLGGSQVTGSEDAVKGRPVAGACARDILTDLSCSFDAEQCVAHRPKLKRLCL